MLLNILEGLIFPTAGKQLKPKPGTESVESCWKSTWIILLIRCSCPYGDRDCLVEAEVCTQVKINGIGAHCGCSLMVVLPRGEAQSDADNNAREKQGCTIECPSGILIEWEVVMEISPGRVCTQQLLLPRSYLHWNRINILFYDSRAKP